MALHHITVGARLLVATVAMATMLSACGEDRPEQAGTVDDPSGSSAEKNETRGEDGEDLSKAGRKLSRAEAKAALPKVGALPAGWSVDPEGTMTGEDEDDSDDKYTPKRCAVLLEGLDEADSEPEVEAGVSYTGGMVGPFLGAEISSYEDEVQEDRFGKVLEALKECPKFKVDDGESVTPFSVSALSFPNHGEESAAIRLQATSEGMSFTMDLVAIRIGHNVVTVSQMGLGGPPDIKPLQKAARTTIANLNRG